MIAKLIATAMAGYISHQSRPFLIRFAHGWRDMLLYGTGTLCAAPFVASIYDELDYIQDARRRFYLAYFIGFAAFGFGVLCGWLYDSAEEGT